MAEVMKKATRDSYGEALVELGQENPNIVVFDADLAGATKTGVFKKAFPDRFFDCGIAEGNMMVAAAGMSTCGYVPFASTFAMFAAGRAYEQIRNSIGYPHLNVKIGATHAGISVGEDGATHQRTRRQMVVHAQPATVVDHQRRIAQTKVMAQELPQILHTRGRHVRVAGIHRMAQRIEQRRGLRIARVLPHQTRRAARGAPVPSSTKPWPLIGVSVANAATLIPVLPSE